MKQKIQDNTSFLSKKSQLSIVKPSDTESLVGGWRLQYIKKREFKSRIPACS